MIEFKAKIDEVKSNFFDREKVLQAADRAEVRMLLRFGAYVYTRARSKIRDVGKKGESSKPGKPPRNRLGLLKNFIFFACEERAKSVVIGPTELGGHSGRAPEVLEYGGDETLHSAAKQGSDVQAHYAPRPYMHPAFEEVSAKQLPGLLNNAMR